MDLKFTVSLGANLFRVEGDVPFAEIKPLVVTWLEAASTGDQAAIDAVTARLNQKGHELRDAVENSR